MILKNKNNWNLQNIATLMKANNLDFLLKEYNEIVVTSNSIKHSIFCNQKRIRIVTKTPFILNFLLYIFSLFLSFLILMPLLKYFENQYKPFVLVPTIIALAICSQIFVLSIYMRINPNVQIERNRIIGLIRDNKE